MGVFALFLFAILMIGICISLVTEVSLDQGFFAACCGVMGAVGVAWGLTYKEICVIGNIYLEALRVFMLSKKVEARPVWKPMHKQPVYADVPAYVNGVSEAIFKVGMCLPAGPCVSDDDVRYIVECVREAVVR